MIENKTAGEKFTYFMNYFILILFGLITLLPFLNVVAKSFSGVTPVVAGKVLFWPIDPQVQTYQFVLREGTFYNSFKISVIITVLGTFLAIVTTAMTAYPLSRYNMRGRKIFLYLWVFVMLFQGGMIPDYLLYKGIGITNTIWAMIFPQMINVFNLLVVKNYFEGLPESLEEAAKIDGASNIRILFQIIIPISLPVLATITLFYAVGYWNDYFNAMLYISKPSLKPLQQYLYDVVTTSMRELESGFGNLQSASIDDRINATPDAVRAATIILSTVPILLVYPFLQRYFIKGIVIGSVKG